MKPIHFFSVGTRAVLLFCATAARLAAQDDPTPKEPLIPRAQEMSAWTITYHYKDAPKQDAPPNQKQPDRVVSMQVEKTGKIYHRVTNWSSGTHSDAWSVGPRQVIKHRVAPTYVIMPSEGPETDDFSKSDFEDLTWITMANYDGYKKGEQPVFVFKAKNTERSMTRQDKYKLVYLGLQMPSGTGPKPQSKPGTPNSTKTDVKVALEQIYGDTSATVVLDASTQLPIAYDDGKIILTYQFATAPTGVLVPPPEVTTILRRFDDYVKGNTLRPSTP